MSRGRLSGESRLHKGEFKPVKSPDGRAKGWVAKMWHRESGKAVPPWAVAARQKGLSHVKRHAAKLKLAGWRMHCGDWRQNWGWYTWDASFQFGGMEAWDMNDQVPNGVNDFGAGCFWRGDFDDARWGMPSAYPGSVGYAAECDYPREAAGVEAMFAMVPTWDYFRTRHG